jgi:hypothetical protein
MAHYGLLLDSYGPEREYIYELFSEYFNNPNLIKIKNVDGLSMYCTKILCLLTNEYRYIILFTKEDDNIIGSLTNLKLLFWESLQTRTLEEKFNCNSHDYIPVKSGDLDTIIIRTEYNKKTSEYSSEKFPNLITTLLHTKKDDMYEYQNKGTIITAIETYQTIFSFKN